MGSRGPGDQVPRRRQAEEIGHRLGRLARRAEVRGEAQVPRAPSTPHHGGTKAAGGYSDPGPQAKAAATLSEPPKKRQGNEISDLMSR